MNDSDKIKVLVDFFKEESNYIRHYEDIRFKLSQISLIVAAALLGIVHAQLVATHVRVFASLAVTALGFFGVLFVIKYSERSDRHATLARRYRRAISDILRGDQSLEDMREEASARHNKAAGFKSRIRARYFWMGIHACIFAFGATSLAINFDSVRSAQHSRSLD